MLQTLRGRFSRRKGSRGLQARLRLGGLLMLIPLICVAVASVVALSINTGATAALRDGGALQDRIDLLHQHLTDTALTEVQLLADHGSLEVTAVAASESQVTADLALLARLPGITGPEIEALQTVRASWDAGAADRGALIAAAAHPAGPLTVAVEDQVANGLTAALAQLDKLNALNDAQLARLVLRAGAALQGYALTLVVALPAGLAAAIWLSRQLARAILQPLNRFRVASERLAAGDASQRLAIESIPELAELSHDFNVTAQRLEEHQRIVRERERRLTALVEKISDGIVIVDAAGLVVFATPSFSEQFPPGSVISARLQEIVHPDDAARVVTAWAEAVAAGEGGWAGVDARLIRADGSWRYVRSTVTNRLADPAVSGIVLNVVDISERHEHEERLSFQAQHDALTGLANRDLFRAALEGAAAPVTPSSMTSVLCINLDDFRRLNDALGRHAGDELLVEVARRLTSAVRPQDMVARLSGDEYAILLEGSAGPAALTTAERVLQALVAPLTIDGRKVVTTATIGIASGVPGSMNPETWLGNAHLAMHVAKRSGKARCQEFSPAMRAELMDRVRLGDDLRGAIDREDLTVQYQPIVNLATGAVVGAEALARWEHPTRGWVGPVIFIPLAEELNIVGRIDRWILHETCRQGRAWADAGLPELRLAVNLSGSDLAAPDLVAFVAATLGDTGFAAANLELELTEGVAITESTAAQATLRELKGLGLRLSIDDFGTGYSALARLRALPFDTLKVDKTFVDELEGAAPGSTLAETILDMARVLGLEVVAEGVESEPQAEFLRRRKCDFAQGYLFSRPVHPAVFASLVMTAKGGRPPAVLPRSA